MSLNAAAIAVMVERGLNAADILAVAEALEVKKDRTGAERQARHREKVKAERDEVTRYVTRDGSDGSPALDKEIPQTPKEIKPTPYVRGTRARLGYHRLPEGWRPTQPLPPQVQAKVDQWPPGARDDELMALKRWAANAEDKNGKGRKLDWDKAWWNWIGRRHDERYGKVNGMGRHQPSDGLSPTTRAARTVFGLGACN